MILFFIHLLYIYDNCLVVQKYMHESTASISVYFSSHFLENWCRGAAIGDTDVSCLFV